MAKKTIHIMNTAFRDGFQSVYGARVLTEDFMPAVQACVAAGQTHFEAGGGARFQAPFFYCNESAFGMMDTFRSTVGPDANLQTLARGINVVGLDSQPRDIIDLHAKMFKKHGITTIRNFDALNDVNNLIDSAKSITAHGLKHEVAVTMMELPPGCTGAHTAEFYIKTLQDILDAGIPFDSVCFKDASGTSAPKKVYDTISAARKMLPGSIRITFHSHETAGIGTVGYIAAIKAGADQVDCSLAPASGGTCQPDVATLWHALRGEDYELNVDIDRMMAAAAIFKECMADYLIPPEAKAVDPLIPWSPMPGGALTANTQMLRDNNMMDKYEACIQAMGEVVRRGGFATSVTPVSQFYFQQAFNNVVFGPWERFAEGYGKMVLGYFGRTPVAPDPEIVKLAAGKTGLDSTTENPVDLNDADPDKGVEAARKTLQKQGLEETDENLFIAATCKQKGIDFLLGKAVINGVRKRSLMPEPPPEAGAGAYAVTIAGTTYNVALQGDKATVNGRTYDFAVAAGQMPAASGAAPGGTGVEVGAPMNAKVVKVNIHVGDQVAEGDTLFVLEAMKMELDVKATAAGKVALIAVQVGDQVAAGDKLASIS